jgi:hypothetical protein
MLVFSSVCSNQLCRFLELSRLMALIGQVRNGGVPMNKKNTPLWAGLLLAMAMSLALPITAEASNRQFKNTVGGAAIGAGVGALVGGGSRSSVRTGAIVGAIAGAVK